MTMNDLQHLIARELDGENTASESERLQSILDGSIEAKAEFNDAKTLHDLMQTDRDLLPTSSPNVPDRIMEALNRDASRAQSLPNRFAAVRLMAAVAALLLVVGASFWAGRTTVEARTSGVNQSISNDLDQLEALGVNRMQARAAFEQYRDQIAALEERTSKASAELYRELEATLYTLKQEAIKRR
jgi:septation ring formation regulator EzrA